MPEAEKKHITIGILAHVDAGKTTLSEQFLYETGVKKQAGRVDNGDTLLDHDEMERSRGITIFSNRQSSLFLIHRSRYWIRPVT